MKVAIFGCGNIAHRIAKGIQLVSNMELVGFGSSNIQKAKEYALLYNCKEYGDYDYFLNSDIDGVYVANYNPGHYQTIRDCLTHHKHVLCEKPMLSSLQENEELFELAKENNCILMEAMKAVFLPIQQKVKTILQEGTLGSIQYIETIFARNGSHDPNHWINDLKTGGALKDLGSYCVATMNYLLDDEPTITYKYTNRTTISDNFAEVCLDYHGIQGHCIASNSVDLDCHLMIGGTRGMLYVPNFWKVGQGYYIVDNKRYELNEEMINDFYYECKHFAFLFENKKLASDIMSKQASDNILKVTK